MLLFNCSVMSCLYVMFIMCLVIHVLDEERGDRVRRAPAAADLDTLQRAVQWEGGAVDGGSII